VPSGSALLRSIQHVEIGIKEIDPCKKVPMKSLMHKFGTYHHCKNRSHKLIAKKSSTNGLPEHFAVVANIQLSQLINHLLIEPHPQNRLETFQGDNKI
jgi:hypothetical protein